MQKDFAGSDRFVIERQLGAGSMGTVYLAYDRQLESRVALKTLLSVDASSIYRFKKEFRALADVSHRNLVTLHELFSDGDQWFFTMEYIEGQDLLSYVHGGRRRNLDSLPRPSLPPEPRAHDTFDGHVTGMEMLFPSPLRDEVRLRNALCQVIDGLKAVHAAGKLHRDLKPENVLVTKDGRAVLLDFGIAVDQQREIHETLATAIGTPAYMSPEQCTGRGVTEATDWYAFGVMLYEALTGDVPFDGTPMEVIKRKQEVDPTPPSQIVSEVPPDLDQLCVRLLSRDPEHRPDADQILRVLRAQPAVSPPAEPVARAGTPFVGRAAQLKDLESALDATDADKPVLALVHGPSGIGKTTLVDHFAEEIASTHRAIVLRGRCYENETVPFKAFDNVIDSLSRYLRRLPAVEVASMLPREVDALAELFPVLKRVDVLRKSRRRKALPQAPQELRQRAFRALKEMFGRIADLEPLVVFIDDLQWSDIDSVRLLVELITGSERPSLLLVCVYRSEEQAHGRGLKWLMNQVKATPSLDVREIGVGVLSPEESLDLALHLLGTRTYEGARRISFESQGSPHLLTQLARHVQDRRASGLASPETARGLISFERVLDQRLSQLSQDARTLLELLSVAARPVPESMLTLVASFAIQLSTALAELRGAKLIRGVAAHNTRAVEVFHDTIREALVKAMDPETLTSWHRRLAAALEASGAMDLEALTTHLLGAGDHERAAMYAERAAAQAAKSLAFDKAARLYALASEHCHASRRPRLLRCLADSLVSAGRGDRAAEVFMRAGEQAADPAEADELRARAGVQQLLVGQLEGGLAALRTPLSRLGFEIPNSRDEALRAAGEHWQQLRRRGFAFEQAQSADQHQKAQCQRYDILREVASGLLLHEIDRSLPLVTHCLDVALALGDAGRLVGALGLYHAHVDLPFSRIAGVKPSGALDVAEALARRIPEAQARAEIAFARGAAVFHEGNAKASLSELARAEELFRMHCPGAVFEIRMARLILAHVSVTVTRRPDASQLVDWRREAEERRDLVSSQRLRVLEGALALAEDDAARAEHLIGRALEESSTAADPLTQAAGQLTLGALALYRSGFVEARRHLYGLDEFFGTTAARIPLLRAQALLLSARLSLLLQAAPDAPRGLVERASAHVDEAQGLGLGCFEDDVRLTRAALAVVQGDHSTALALLDAVLVEHDGDAVPPITALFAMRAKGWLLGGVQGRGMATDATSALVKRGIKHPARFSRQLTPGLEAALQSR